MNVRLQVIGIFYDQSITVAGPGNSITVKQVLDAAVGQAPNGVKFKYLAGMVPGGPVGQYVSFMSAHHPGPFNSKSGKPYPAGLYSLTQTFTAAGKNPYSVWQYYVLDRNKLMVSSGERPFDKVSDVMDGYTVIWRLVTICARPQIINPRLAALVEQRPSEA